MPVRPTKIKAFCSAKNEKPRHRALNTSAYIDLLRKNESKKKKENSPKNACNMSGLNSIAAHKNGVFANKKRTVSQATVVLKTCLARMYKTLAMITKSKRTKKRPKKSMFVFTPKSFVNGARK